MSLRIGISPNSFNFKLSNFVELTLIPGVNISLMAEGPVYKGFEDPKIYRRHDLLLLGVSA